MDKKYRIIVIPGRTKAPFSKGVVVYGVHAPSASRDASVLLGTSFKEGGFDLFAMTVLFDLDQLGVRLAQ